MEPIYRLTLRSVPAIPFVTPVIYNVYKSTTPLLWLYVTKGLQSLHCCIHHHGSLLECPR